jgi:hypothetical protein
MANSSFVSIASNVSINSDTASDLFHVAIADNEVSLGNDLPRHWERHHHEIDGQVVPMPSDAHAERKRSWAAPWKHAFNNLSMNWQ